MLGQILIYVAFGLSILSGIFYLIAKDKPGLLKLGRFSYYGVTAVMLSISKVI